MIKEISYDMKVSKSPIAIATFLIQQFKKTHSTVNIPPFLTGGVRVNIERVGLSLLNKNRMEFAKASKLLFKKKIMLFLLGTDEVALFMVKKMDWKTQEYKKPKNKSLGFIGVHDLFKSYGVSSGGKQAFYSFIRRLDKKNKTMNKQLAVGAVYIHGEVPAMFMPKSWLPYSWKDESEEPIPESVEQFERPDTKISVPPTKLKTEEKKVGGDLLKQELPANKLKSLVCDTAGGALQKTFQGNLDRSKAFVNSSLSSWADSSTESNGSLYLQTAVANLAKMKPQNIAPFLKWAKSIKRDGARYFYKGNKFSYKNHGSDQLFSSDPEIALLQHEQLAATIYKHTQDFLKKKGVKQLILFRGMEKSSNFSGFGVNIKKVTIKMNPLSSFSHSLEECLNFGPYIIAAVIPAARIFSCPLTGHGCYEEEEFVVIGGKMKGWGFDYSTFEDKKRDLIDKLEYDMEKIDSKIQDIEDRIAELEDRDSDQASNKAEELREKRDMLQEEYDRIESESDGIADDTDLTYNIEQQLEKIMLGEQKPVLSAEEEPEQEINVDEGDNADWTKQKLDVSLPLIGTPEFEEYLKQSGKTIEQLLAMPAYRLAHIKYAPVVAWLQRMAVTLDSEKAKAKVKPIAEVKQTLCHLATLNGIRERKDARDKIWFFGDNDGRHPHVYHSLLTNKSNKVVANNFRGVGNDHILFDPTKGYRTPAGEYLPILDTLTVREFFKRFFTAKP